jgi:hypothetical protein
MTDVGVGLSDIMAQLIKTGRRENEAVPREVLFIII